MSPAKSIFYVSDYSEYETWSAEWPGVNIVWNSAFSNNKGSSVTQFSFSFGYLVSNASSLSVLVYLNTQGSAK